MDTYNFNITVTIDDVPLVTETFGPYVLDVVCGENSGDIIFPSGITKGVA